MSLRILISLAVVLLLAPRVLAQQDPNYVFGFTEASGTPGTTIQVRALLDTTSGEDVVGLQFSVCHDDEVLDLEDDGLTGLDGEDWDTTFCTRTVVDSGYIVTYLMNVISGAVLEPDEYDVLEAEYSILEDAEDGTTTTIEYCTLGSPAVEPLVFSGGDLTPTTEEVVIDIEAPTEFLRGDCRENGDVDVLDVIYMLEGLFTAGPLSLCLSACDVDGENGMTILDAIGLLTYLYLSGDAPADPFEDGCGTFTGQTSEDCESYESCD